MDRIDFITNLFSFFRVDNDELVRTYDMALSVNYNIDWNSFFHYIVKTYEKRMLPMPKFLLDLLPKFRIYEYKTDDKDGEVIVLELLNGHKYIFEVNINANNTLDDIRKQFDGQIKSFKKYPKGTVMIGNEIYIGETEEQ